MQRIKKRKRNNFINYILVCLIIVLIGSSYKEISSFIQDIWLQSNSVNVSYENIPDYSGKSYIILNNNHNNLLNEYGNTSSFESYGKLDSLGRCSFAVANIGQDLMPKEERGSINMVKPSGWHTVKYDFVDGKYLYNRCHLIGFQLTGENANEQNLITCTRSMHTGVMLDYENKVADYIKKTNHHVLYRVTPVFDGTNLLAKGVIMEGKSIEDDKIEFNIFVYNVEDGVKINYQNGDSEPI